MRLKVLVLSLVAATLSIALSSTTIAYLTDVEESIQSFTIGNISIQTLTSSIGRNQTTIDEVTGDPIITNNTDESIIADAEDYDTGYLIDHCTNLLAGDESTDTCKKNIFVLNTGENAAYVRVRIQVPKEYVSGNSPIISLTRTTANDEFIINEEPAGVNCTDESDATTCADLEYVFTRITPLSAQQMTTNPVLESITYNVIATTGSEGENPGETVSEPLDLTTSNIRVFTEAIQAQGFTNATEAFANY